MRGIRHWSPTHSGWALSEERFDRALLLARAGVALDDSVATRGNLLEALLHTPPALLGELGKRTDAEIWGLAVSPTGDGSPSATWRASSRSSTRRVGGRSAAIS